MKAELSPAFLLGTPRGEGVMQYCDVSPKRNTTCPEICAPVERMLRKETGSQRERTFPPEVLDQLSFKAKQKGTGDVWSNEVPVQKNGKYDERIQKILDSPDILSQKKKRILRLYLEGLTHKEISGRVGVSRQQVGKSIKSIIVSAREVAHSLI